MIPGVSTPGRFAIGQVTSSLNADAAGVLLNTAASLTAGTAIGGASKAGVTIEVSSALIEGVASVEMQPTRMMGGVPFVSGRRRHAMAPGAVIEVNAWINAGRATGESITSSGRTVRNSVTELPTHLVTIKGFDKCTEEDKEFLQLLLLDDAKPGRTIIRYEDA